MRLAAKNLGKFVTVSLRNVVSQTFAVLHDHISARERVNDRDADRLQWGWRRDFE